MAIKNGTTPHNNETSRNENDVLSLTIDSNCINAKGNHAYMNKIEILAKKGKVKIYITSTMETEFQKGKGYQKGKDKLKGYDKDIEVGVWGHSRFGSSLWGGEVDSRLFNEIKKTLNPGIKKLNENQIKDSMHLQTHINCKRDFFITDDKKHIISKKNELKDRLGIVVCTPKEYCEKIIKE